MATPRKGYWLDGKRLPSVTTVIGRFKDSGALLHWAFNQGLEQGQAIGEGTREKPPFLYEKRDEAGDIGTLAHEMVEAYVNGENHLKLLLPEYGAEKNEKALNAFQQFRTWLENTKIEIISKWQEQSMMSAKHLYGGTPDAIGRDSNGDLVLLDWKTSKGVYPDMLAQVAIYCQLWEENHPNEPITGGVYILRFAKDYPDFSAHYFGDYQLGLDYFLTARKLYDIDKEMKKRVS